jgi:hypothetical protein
LKEQRFSSDLGLIWGGTSIDWGDVQPEDTPGTHLDGSSHEAADIYDNAMLLIAIRSYVLWLPSDSKAFGEWDDWAATIVDNVRARLWNGEKFVPHVYLDKSPFPSNLDENAIYLHGGTTVAIEAGLLTDEEAAGAFQHMIQNRVDADAFTIGLTVYPPYPAGIFKNDIIRKPYTYQNGGDWLWFGARTVQQMLVHRQLDDAYREFSRMIDLVICHDDFHEWYRRDGAGMGAAGFRGAAGQMYLAIKAFRTWAAQFTD